MNWITGLKNAIDYIEDNLTKGLIIQTLLIKLSHHHFIFSECLEFCAITLLANISGIEGLRLPAASFRLLILKL